MNMQAKTKYKAYNLIYIPNNNFHDIDFHLEVIEQSLS